MRHDFFGFQQLSGCQDPTIPFAKARCIIAGEQIVVGFAQQRIASDAHDLLVLAIDQEIAASQILDVDDGWGIFDNRRQHRQRHLLRRQLCTRIGQLALDRSRASPHFRIDPVVQRLHVARGHRQSLLKRHTLAGPIRLRSLRLLSGSVSSEMSSPWWLRPRPGIARPGCP